MHFSLEPTHKTASYQLKLNPLNKRQLYFSATVFLFGNLTGVAKGLLHYLDTRTYHYNITSQYHH